MKESKELTRKLIQDEYSSVIIAIDALYECNGRSRGDLFVFLRDLLRMAGVVAKIFVSSRNGPDILEAFGDLSKVSINVGNNAADIRRFVEQEVETRLLGGRADDDLKTRVKHALCEKAQGM